MFMVVTVIVPICREYGLIFTICFCGGMVLALNVFYITNHPEVALIAEKYGVDRIWIDLETLGKEERQKGMNTVKSSHNVSDVSKIKSVLSSSEVLVRVNPWNENSVEEINSVVEAGADIIMFPMWKTVEEVQNFIKAVNGRTKTTLLLETKEAVDCIDDVLKLSFDEIHIGLNDLHLSYGMKFMFELLADGTVRKLCAKFKEKGIPYGFGGIARLGNGLIPAEKIIMEHYHLGSTRAILSRSFCNIDTLSDISEVDNRFGEYLPELREYEETCKNKSEEEYNANFKEICSLVEKVVKG